MQQEMHQTAKLLEMQLEGTLPRKKAERILKKKEEKDAERERIEELLKSPGGDQGDPEEDGSDFLSFVGTLKLGRGRMSIKVMGGCLTSSICCWVPRVTLCLVA